MVEVTKITAAFLAERAAEDAQRAAKFDPNRPLLAVPVTTPIKAWKPELKKLWDLTPQQAAEILEECRQGCSGPLGTGKGHCGDCADDCTFPSPWKHPFTCCEMLGIKIQQPLMFKPYGYDVGHLVIRARSTHE